MEGLGELSFYRYGQALREFVKIVVLMLSSGYVGYRFPAHRLEVYLFIKGVHFYKYNAQMTIEDVRANKIEKWLNVILR